MHKHIRLAIVALKLNDNGITPRRIGTHLFRAGSAMALKFAKANRYDIKTMGRWSSAIFIVYIHDQIAKYSKGWTSMMATPFSYFNLKGAFDHIPNPSTP